MVPRALQEVGFTVSFVHSNGQYPWSASQQQGKNLSHNFLLISAMHPFKTRGRFLFCSCAQRSGENTVRQQGLAGSELQTTRVVLLVHLHDQPHFPPAPHPLIAAGNALSTSTAPGSSQEMSWEGQSNLARPDPAHGLPRHSLDRGYSSFCCTDKTQQAVTQHPHCSSGRKTTSEWPQKEKYVWALMAQHVLCLVNDTAKKDVALGQKASAQQQNTLKAQL